MVYITYLWWFVGWSIIVLTTLPTFLGYFFGLDGFATNRPSLKPFTQWGRLVDVAVRPKHPMASNGYPRPGHETRTVWGWSTDHFCWKFPGFLKLGPHDDIGVSLSSTEAKNRYPLKVVAVVHCGNVTLETRGFIPLALHALPVFSKSEAWLHEFPQQMAVGDDDLVMLYPSIHAGMTIRTIPHILMTMF